MVAFDKVAGVGEQFVNTELPVGEQVRRTRASERCRGVTGTDTRQADGEVINIYTDAKTQVTSIRACVQKSMYDKELKPRSEYSKLEKAEKEAKKTKLPAPGSDAGDDTDGESDSSEELDRREALDSRHGYFWTENYQQYLDKFQKKKDSEAILSRLKPFMKHVLLLVRARHEHAVALLKQMKEKFVDMQEKAATEEVVAIKKKCLMLKRARLALLKECTSLTPFEAALKARVVVREQIKQAAATEQIKQAVGGESNSRPAAWLRARTSVDAGGGTQYSVHAPL